MKFELDDKQMKSLFSEALLTALGEGQRNNIIKEAIAHLTTKTSEGYGKGITPIQQAFNEAVQSHAHQAARKFFEENEEARKSIDEAIIEGYRKFVSGFHDGKLYEAIAEKIGSAFKNSDRY